MEIAPYATIYKNKPETGQFGIQDGQKFEAEGVSLKALLCPGHTNDHTAFILQEENAIFTGDSILGHGTTGFEDLLTYLSSLDKLRGLCRGRIYPGHGPVIQDGPSKILEYINHRKERENQVIGVLSSSKFSSNLSNHKKENHDWSSMEIVSTLYGDIADELRLSAQRIVQEILKKLEQEGKVVEIGRTGSWRLNFQSMK